MLQKLFETLLLKFSTYGAGIWNLEHSEKAIDNLWAVTWIFITIISLILGLLFTTEMYKGKKFIFSVKAFVYTFAYLCVNAIIYVLVAWVGFNLGLSLGYVLTGIVFFIYCFFRSLDVDEGTDKIKYYIGGFNIMGLFTLFVVNEIKAIGKIKEYKKEYDNKINNFIK